MAFLIYMSRLVVRQLVRPRGSDHPSGGALEGLLTWKLLWNLSNS